MFALATASNKYTPRQICHLDYISQFTIHMRHVVGPNNPVADGLSHNAVNALYSKRPASVDLQALGQAQTALQNSSLTCLQLVGPPTSRLSLYYHLSYQYRTSSSICPYSIASDGVHSTTFIVTSRSAGNTAAYCRAVCLAKDENRYQDMDT